jgi:hypothetical protein
MLPLLFVTLVVAWGAAIVVAGRRVVREPLVRACVVGPVVGIGVFVLTSPYAEVRFVDPAFLLMFACVALSLAALPSGTAPFAGIGIVVASVYTGFFVNRWTFIGGGALVAAIFTVMVILQDRVLRLGARGGAVLAGACALAVSAYLYVYHDPEIRQYERLTHAVWSSQYGRIADGWEFVRRQVPAGAVVAYTNSQFAYPLMGFEGNRRVVYAPTRAGVTGLHTLPRVADKIPGERLAEEVSRVTVAEADRGVWVENLKRVGAEYLFVAKAGVVQEPPELGFARAEPGRFQGVFENEEVVVYRIAWEGK